MTRTRIAFLSSIGLLCGAAVQAEEQTLPFTLVVTFVEDAALPSAPEGMTAAASRAVGVATFEDGRTAFKEFVVLQSGGEQEGEMTGYSTYTFENGDSLYLKFTGGWSPQGTGGDYTVLSGTGAFEGATGTGRFDAREETWERAELFDGSFTLEMPGS